MQVSNITFTGTFAASTTALMSCSTYLYSPEIRDEIEIILVEKEKYKTIIEIIKIVNI